MSLRLSGEEFKLNIQQTVSFCRQVERSPTQGPTENKALDKPNHKERGVLCLDIIPVNTLALTSGDQAFDAAEQLLHELPEDGAQDLVLHVQFARKQNGGNSRRQLDEL